jgi:endonuclease III
MILQRILVDEDRTGFRMLVGCVLLNLTQRVQVDPVYPVLFDRWPTPHDLQFARMGELEKVLGPLGLQHRRAMTLRKLATWWVEADRSEGRDERVLAMEPPGIGEYARDSWVIFYLGLLPQWPVHDRALLEHLTATDPGLHGQWGSLRRPWEPDGHFNERTA